MNKFNQREQTKLLTMSAILIAIVFILQFMGSFIRFGMFSISLVLVPIVIGAALCGVGVGALLGLVFGIAVLLSGDATSFFAISVPGTIITVLAKGVLCGTVAGLVYKLFAKKNKVLAVFLAAIICPVVNTGVFLLGCFVFFLDAIKEMATKAEFATAVEFMIIAFVGGNFVFEVLVNAILSPVIIRILNIRKIR